MLTGAAPCLGGMWKACDSHIAIGNKVVRCSCLGVSIPVHSCAQHTRARLILLRYMVTKIVDLYCNTIFSLKPISLVNRQFEKIVQNVVENFCNDY